MRKYGRDPEPWGGSRLKSLLGRTVVRAAGRFSTLGKAPSDRFKVSGLGSQSLGKMGEEERKRKEKWPERTI